MRYSCWTCGAVRSLDDATIEGCCLDTLVEMAREISKTLSTTALSSLIQQRNEIGDAIADKAIVSDDPRARRAAIAWRNFRRE